MPNEPVLYTIGMTRCMSYKWSAPEEGGAVGSVALHKRFAAVTGIRIVEEMKLQIGRENWAGETQKALLGDLQFTGSNLDHPVLVSICDEGDAMAVGR